MGWTGTVVTRPPGGGGFVRQEVADADAFFVAVDFGAQGEAVIVGSGGTVLAGPSGGDFAGGRCQASTPCSKTSPSARKARP